MKKDLCTATNEDLKLIGKQTLSKTSFMFGTFFGFILMGIIFTATLIVFSLCSVPKFNTIVFRDVDGKLSVTQYKTYTENKNDGTIEFEAKDGTIYTTIDDYIILNAK